MLSKRYESTEVDRRTWLHVPSGTPWSTSSDTHQVVEIQIETSIKTYTPNDTLIKDVNRLIYKFLWNSRDRIKRNTLIGPVKSGGINVVDIVTKLYIRLLKLVGYQDL